MRSKLSFSFPRLLRNHILPQSPRTLSQPSPIRTILHRNLTTKPQHSPPSQKRTSSHIKPLLLTTLTILLLSHLLKRHIMLTTGPSMLPTIPASGSFVIVNRFAKYGKGVRVGDVICAKHAFLEGEGIVKRVIGVGGDFVSISVDSNSPLLSKFVPEKGDEEEEKEEGIYDSTARLGRKVTLRVPDGHVFLQGDNVSASLDSRLYGPVPAGLIVGKVIGVIYWEGWFWKFEKVGNGLVAEEGW